MSAELLQACRGSVKADLMRYEQLLLSCKVVSGAKLLEAEANRLRALLDAIDAQPASSERVALTDEQILEAFSAAGLIASGRIMRAAADNIFAAHGIHAPARGNDAPTSQIKNPTPGIPESNDSEVKNG